MINDRVIGVKRQIIKVVAATAVTAVLVISIAVARADMNVCY
jgi:hypothetical protein